MFCSKIIFDEIQVDWRNKADFVKNGDGIMSEEIRDKKITIRVSQREKENIEKKAEQAKMSMSKYLLAAAETEPLPPKGGRFNQRLKPPKVDRIPARRYLLFSQQFFLSTPVSIFCYLHNVIFMSYVQ